MTKLTPAQIATLSKSRLPADEEIARRVKNGERALYEVLVRRHDQRLFRAIRSVLGSETDAQELLQDTFVRAYTSLEQFEGRGPFAGWLIRIALNAAYAHRRRTLDSASPPLEQPEDVRAQPTPEQIAASGEMTRLLERVVDGLPDHYRTVFVLRLVEEMSTAEVADALQVTADVVKTRLTRARNLVRKQLTALADVTARTAFTFKGQRCDRLVAAVLRRVPPRRNVMSEGQ